MMTIRRREALDRALDRMSAADPAAPRPEVLDDVARLLQSARLLPGAMVRSVAPAVAEDHLATLRRDRARAFVVVPTARRRGLRAGAVALLAGAVLLLGAGGAVAASSNALPGDALYGVKRAVERISLAMHRDPVGRAALHLQLAKTRLDEIQALIDAGRDPGGDVGDFEAELSAAEEDALNALALGKDADALLAHVQEMITKHLQTLRNVLAAAPPQAQDAINHAIQNAQTARDKIRRGRIEHAPATRGKPSSPGKSGGSPGRQ
jgi:hypothetical protein